MTVMLSSEQRAQTQPEQSRPGKPLSWRATFAIGHETIDREHRILLALINDLVAEASPEGHHERVPHALKMLRLATEDHFRTEGAVLWEFRNGTNEGLNRSPKAKYVLSRMASTVFDEHIEEHTSLMAQFDQFERLPMEALGDAVKSWFVDHAVKRDAQLKSIFQAMK